MVIYCRLPEKNKRKKKENKNTFQCQQPVKSSNSSNYITVTSSHILAAGLTLSLPWIDFRFPNCVSEPLFLPSEIIGDILSEACYAFANKALRIPRFSGRKWDDKKRAGIGVAISPNRTCYLCPSVSRRSEVSVGKCCFGCAVVFRIRKPVIVLYANITKPIS